VKCPWCDSFAHVVWDSPKKTKRVRQCRASDQHRFETEEVFVKRISPEVLPKDPPDTLELDALRRSIEAWRGVLEG
jgi:transcriptional regulator NrdR family protein